jgi:hypothetical protein
MNSRGLHCPVVDTNRTSIAVSTSSIPGCTVRRGLRPRRLTLRHSTVRCAPNGAAVVPLPSICVVR